MYVIKGTVFHMWILVIPGSIAIDIREPSRTLVLEL